ncbi:FadR/GntR family transcriptional regulator [Georgenia thermotolerans]|uniref:FCD domain-containing protein n=1 Tax=Georgenia thermotolerans TaxID=527326 RepID=A0A7J5UT40_9MICO|nr:FCD domain-containing protein [Georgenia thermotolerans]KAE8765507.1 FCD domain-containing protein [Georgenia thermotolerans]
MVVRGAQEKAPVLHTDVLDRLGSDIAHGHCPPGSVLTLAQLAERFEVSRTVIREAVRVLESLGMVESRRRVGVTVRPVHDWSVLEPRVIRWRLTGPQRDAQLHRLTELRLALEPTAARLAALKAPAPVGARLLELAATLRRLGEAGEGAGEDYLEADIEFHTLLIAASDNDMLAALRGAVTEVLAGRTHLHLTPKDPVPVSLDHHEAVARAVAEHDEDGAERHARAVVMEVWNELRDVRFTPPLDGAGAAEAGALPGGLGASAGADAGELGATVSPGAGPGGR